MTRSRAVLGDYIQMAPGGKTKATMLYADSSIELGGGGRPDPFHHPGPGAVRQKDFVVTVPPRTPSQA